MSHFSDQCARLEAALGAAYDSSRDKIDCCIWPGMPAHYRGHTWAIQRNGKYIALGEKFSDALVTATRMGRRRNWS